MSVCISLNKLLLKKDTLCWQFFWGSFFSWLFSWKPCKWKVSKKKWNQFKHNKSTKGFRGWWSAFNSTSNFEKENAVNLAIDIAKANYIKSNKSWKATQMDDLAIFFENMDLYPYSLEHQCVFSAKSCRNNIFTWKKYIGNMTRRNFQPIQ